MALTIVCHCSPYAVHCLSDGMPIYEGDERIWQHYKTQLERETLAQLQPSINPLILLQRYFPEVQIVDGPAVAGSAFFSARSLTTVSLCDSLWYHAGNTICAGNEVCQQFYLLTDCPTVDKILVDFSALVGQIQNSKRSFVAGLLERYWYMLFSLCNEVPYDNCNNKI